MPPSPPSLRSSPPPSPSHQYEGSQESAKKSSASGAGTQTRGTPLIHRDTRCPAWISTEELKNAPQLGTRAEHISSSPPLPAKSTHVTDFSNVSPYKEEHAKVSAQNKLKNNNNNGEYPEPNGEVIPEVRLLPPLHQGDPNSPYVTEIDPDKPFSVISLFYGKDPAPWISTTKPGYPLITSGVSGCVAIPIMATSPDGKEGILTMAHSYRKNEQTHENIEAKINEMRELGYTGDLFTFPVGAWVTEENYERDRKDRGLPEGGGEAPTPERLAEIRKHAEEVVDSLHRLGCEFIDDWTRENRPPYEHSNRFSNIAAYMVIIDGRVKLSVFPDARFRQDIASGS